MCISAAHCLRSTATALAGASSTQTPCRLPGLDFIATQQMHATTAKPREGCTQGTPGTRSKAHELGAAAPVHEEGARGRLVHTMPLVNKLQTAS